MTLYRAAPAEAPYFGRGSYWSTSRQFAGRFSLWLDQTYGGSHVIYRADVELGRVLSIPFSTRVPSTQITELVDDFAAEGYQWVTFYEGVFEADVVLQWVYLGDTPIAAELAA